MIDYDLLELAAKVEGGKYIYDTQSHSGRHWIRRGHHPLANQWNPLDNDGDAMRLACNLMYFEPYKSNGYLPINSSDLVETRRAIVRAAAEIGKAMP